MHFIPSFGNPLRIMYSMLILIMVSVMNLCSYILLEIIDKSEAVTRRTRQYNHQERPKDKTIQSPRKAEGQDNTITKKGRRTNRKLQSTTQKTNDWTSRTRGELMYSERVSNSFSIRSTRCVNVKWHEHYLILKLFWTPVYVNQYK